MAAVSFKSPRRQNASADSQAEPDNVRTDAVAKTSLTVNATQVVSESGQVRRLIQISGNYNDRTASGVGTLIERVVESFFQMSFDDEGILYSLELDIERFSGIEGRADINFVNGTCAKNFACADVGGPNLYIDDLWGFMASNDAIAHEFGHLIGYWHWPNGVGNFMSYDRNGKITSDQVKLLWNKYNLD